MKVVFMGTPQFACPPLVALRSSRHQVMAVVTGSDKPVGRGHRLESTPVRKEAEGLNLNVLTPRSLKDPSLAESLRKTEADLFVVIAFRILPESLFSLPSRGSINIHASLLPRYRGAAPINWALINGETETGLTSFFLKSQVDTGDLILQESTPISPDDTYDTLSSRLSEMAGPFLLKTLDVIESGRVATTRQNDGEATPAPKITPFNSMIDFGFPAEQVRNFIRGLSSRPGARTTFRGKRVKLLEGKVAPGQQSDHRPGTILPDRRLLVQCRDSVLEITRLVPEGKSEMDGPAFVNGFRPQPAELLGVPMLEAKEKK